MRSPNCAPRRAQYPERRPGSSGDDRLARRRRLHAAKGSAAPPGAASRCMSATSPGQTIDGERTLTTVIAQRPGLDERGADRDPRPQGRERAGSGGRIVRHGGAAGAGARVRGARDAAHDRARLDQRWQRRRRRRGRTGLAARRARAPRARSTRRSCWATSPARARAAVRRPLLRLLRLRAAGSCSAPLPTRSNLRPAGDPGAPSAIGQLAHLMFPMAVGEQGVQDAQGLPAVLVQASSERGPSPGASPSARNAWKVSGGPCSAPSTRSTRRPTSPQAMQTGVLLAAQDAPRVGSAPAPGHAAAPAARRRPRTGLRACAAAASPSGAGRSGR